MKYIFLYKKQSLLVLCMLVLLATAGCSIYDDLDPCKYYRLVVKVVNPQGEDITGAGDVQNASLYIFDENKKLLEVKSVSAEAIKNRQEIELDYLAERDLQVIAFGNTANQEVPQLQPGDALEKLYVKVKEENGYGIFPDKIFNGVKAVSTKAAGDGDVQLHEVVIQEKVSSVQAYTLGFANYLKNHSTKAAINLDDYSFYVNRTPNTLTYEGVATGDSLVYDPEVGIIEGESEISTAYNNVLPAQGFSVDLDLPDGNKITVTHAIDEKDGVLKPLYVDAGERRAVVFTFDDNGTFVGATMTVRPWGTGDDQNIIF